MTAISTTMAHPIDPDRFRAAMGGVCTPVAVVTTAHDGVPHGTMVSAFISLSIAPPMILVALDLGSELLAMVRRSGTFGVNVLGAGADRWALAFARKGGDKFAGIDWHLDDDLPRLDDAATWLACSVAGLLPGGDHMIVTGLVHSAEVQGRAPLIYHNRTFGTHRALPSSRSSRPSRAGEVAP